MANDHWLQETQAVPLASETSALISLLAELIDLTAEMETGVSTPSVPAQGKFPGLITRNLYLAAYSTN